MAAACKSDDRSDAEQASYGFATRCLHAGVTPDPFSGAVMTPISLSSTFAQTSPGQLFAGGFDYCRSGNPTRQAFETCIASLEEGHYGLAFSSGLAAVSAVYQLLEVGSEIIAIDDLYGGSSRLFRRAGPPHTGITLKQLNLEDPQVLETSITPATKLLWLETPTNPTLKIADIQALCAIARRHGVLTLVDNTFSTPYFQLPLHLGADIVLHSVTKYLNGHSDVIMGALVLNDSELYSRLKLLQNTLGGVPSPFDCFLALRGVKTLPLRMRQHASSALAVARFLNEHPKVAKCMYPGLPSHPQHELAKRQMKGYSGMVTCVLDTDLAGVRRFMEALRIFTIAESLGGVESLANHPAIMTHASVPIETRERLGIGDSMIRLSVGLEDEVDILADLAAALAKI